MKVGNACLLEINPQAESERSQTSVRFGEPLHRAGRTIDRSRRCKVILEGGGLSTTQADALIDLAQQHRSNVLTMSPSSNLAFTRRRPTRPEVTISWVQFAIGSPRLSLASYNFDTALTHEAADLLVEKYSG